MKSHYEVCLKLVNNEIKIKTKDTLNGMSKTTKHKGKQNFDFS